jgi:predicted DNA-binding transcriptional regulator YafY
MNRTDRLYALVEELRAVSPRPRSAAWLARRFEVGVRTIRRDLVSLQQAGVPVYAKPGRAGGYAVDGTHSLPPVNITSQEAIAATVALRALDGGPLADEARTVLQKLLTAMAPSDRAASADLAARVHVLRPSSTADGGETEVGPGVPSALAQAVVGRRVVEIGYVDVKGAVSTRLVESLALLMGEGGLWYLIGWCRLRGNFRGFRIDRIRYLTVTDEQAPDRQVDPTTLAPGRPAAARIERLRLAGEPPRRPPVPHAVLSPRRVLAS